MFELVAGRLVPVGIEAQQRDPRRRLGRQRVLDLALDEDQLVGGISRRRHVAPHFGEAGVGPFVVVAALEVLPARNLLGAVAGPAVDLAGARHAGEGVVEVDLARRVAEGGQGQGHHHGASPPPHPALDQIARHVPRHHVLDALVKGVHAFHRGHGEGRRLGADLGERRVHVARDAEAAPRHVVLRQPAQAEVVAEAVGELLERGLDHGRGFPVPERRRGEPSLTAAAGPANGARAAAWRDTVLCASVVPATTGERSVEGTMR